MSYLFIYFTCQQCYSYVKVRQAILEILEGRGEAWNKYQQAISSISVAYTIMSSALYTKQVSNYASCSLLYLPSITQNNQQARRCYKIGKNLMLLAMSNSKKMTALNISQTKTI
ncbi:hypothetical protein ABPG72_004189 [Tetrahymena utriculariae]